MAPRRVRAAARVALRGVASAPGRAACLLAWCLRRAASHKVLAVLLVAHYLVYKQGPAPHLPALCQS